MAEILPTQTIITTVIGLLNSLMGELESWQGPSKSAFETKLNEIMSALETADKCITAALVVESTIEYFYEIGKAAEVAAEVAVVLL